MKTKYAIIAVLIALIAGCGSKKSVSQSRVKEKTDIELTDHSKINTKIEQEQQFVNTNTKERIVTYYGVKMVPYPVNGDTVLIPFPYPEKKEEDRETSEQMEKWKITVQDSIQKAVELKYEKDLKEKDKQISEFKETKTLYHIAMIMLGIGFILLPVLRK